MARMELRTRPRPLYRITVDADELRAWVALSLIVDGRPESWLRLVRVRGSARAVVAAGDDTLGALGASNAAIAMLRDADRRADAAIARCRRLAIEIAPHQSPAYPELLRTIGSPPVVLFWKGRPPAELAPCIAVVGARRASAYGERTARRLGADAAAAKITVASGLARGIDAAAHRGALESGRTVAVLAGGLDAVYPPEHRELAERIGARGGTVVSEQAPGMQPRPWLFPYRNRIITGMSAATVVVEAGPRSGSLASARHALDQGREVFSVPGPIDAPTSEGTNRLLTQGATPYCGLGDLGGVEALKERIAAAMPKRPKKKRISFDSMPAGQATVLAAIGSGATTPDEMALATGLDGTRVLTFLTALELDGLVRREDHGRFRLLVRGV